MGLFARAKKMGKYYGGYNKYYGKAEKNTDIYRSKGKKKYTNKNRYR